MILGVTAEEVRRSIATIPDSVSAPMRTAGWLALLKTVMTLAAGGRRVPGHPVAGLQRLSGPVAFEPFADQFDAPNGFVTEDDRKRDRKLSLPKMHVGAADSRHRG